MEKEAYLKSICLILSFIVVTKNALNVFVTNKIVRFHDYLILFNIKKDNRFACVNGK